MYRSLKMDAAKNGKGRLTLKSIFSKMAQKWPKNCIFSTFPLIFLMVIGEIVEKYFFPTYTDPNCSFKTWTSKIADVNFLEGGST